MRNLLISAAAIALATVPASAATIQVNFSSTLPVPANNNFKTIAGANNDLTDLGFTSFTALGASLILSGPARITFEYLGSESGAFDTFSAGALSLTERRRNFDNRFTTPIGFGTGVFAGGSLAGIFNYSTNNPTGQAATVGNDGFGIFLTRGQTSGQSFSTLYFGYDDDVTGDDDNHDDFLVRATVTAVPEPAAWAMMIGGFGLAGVALRRRRTSVRVTYA